MKAWCSLACSLVVVTVASRAAAQAETPEQAAEREFVEARALVDAGNYAAACPKLARSLELDLAIGTEFNLADCLERTGQLAAAWRHFREVETTAHRVAKTEREQSAHQRATALDERIGQIQIDVPPSVDLLTLTLDGAPLSRAPDPVRVDPGQHTLLATASGREPWQASFGIVAKQRLQLRLFPADAPAVPAVAPPRSQGTTQRRIAVGVGAVGVLALAAGTVAGIVAVGKHGTANDLCAEPKRCGSHDGVSAWNDATTAGNVSTAALIGGGVVLAAGVVLWLAAPRALTRARLGPALLGGTF